MAERHPPACTSAVRILLALLAVAVGALAGPHGAGAQTAAATGVVSLVRQTMWRQGDQPVSFGLAIQASAPESLEVGAALYRRIGSRSEFAQTLQGRFASRPIVEIPATAVADLPPDDAGTPTLTFDPSVTRDGVYPLRIELRPKGGGKALDSFVTYVVDLPEAPEGDPLEVSWIVPIHANPAIEPDGRTNIDDGRAEALGRLAAALNRHADVAFSLDVTPETAEALGASARSEDRDTLAALVAASKDHELLGGPYVATNLSAMVDASLESEATAQLARGASTLRSLFGTDPTTTTRTTDERLSDAALGFLQGQPQPVNRLVIPEVLLEPMARNTTLANPFAVDGRKGRVAAVQADTALADHLGTPNAALAAAQVVADLSQIYFDAPGVKRGAVLLPPPTWEPSAPFADALLGALSANPVLRGATVDQLFADVPPEQTAPVRGQTDHTLVRKVVAATAAPTPSLPGATIRDSRNRFEGFASAVDTTNPAGAAVVDRIDRTLLAAESSTLRTRDRNAYLAGVSSQLDAEMAGITMPRTRSITLTARSGTIPVTVTRRLAYPAHIVLRVQSDTLEFPGSPTRDLELTLPNTTTQFTVRAPASGSFPLRVRMETPVGGVVIAESRFTVRSTAISGVGTALSIGALLFLLVWWGNHLRGRRSRRLVPAGSAGS